jgi:deoxyadenosine/deoxycytidine kinase
MNQPLIVSIEGNIGIGKSTLLNNVELYCKNNGLTSIIVLREPEEEWSKIIDENGETILSNFYKDPNKYSFSFQILVLKTMADLICKTIKENPDCKIIICERSIVSSSHVFAEMLYESSLINQIEYQIYKSIYNEKIDYRLNNFKIVPEKIIYLECDPEICFERIKKRSRKGETNISLDYLYKCENYHNLWLEIEENSIDIMRTDMDLNFEYDLNNKNNLGCKLIDQLMEFVQDGITKEKMD